MERVDIKTRYHHRIMLGVMVEGFGDEKVLQSNIDYACSHQVDCGPIQPSGSCFLPDTLTSHASFAMNSYWRLYGQTPQNCDFNGSGTITSDDPSNTPILLILITFILIRSLNYS
ncbi:hypothetical protein EZV62_027148 [Acer yangbiense]|uniref:X8 domain-containing protein n=1 Tax=Acer yangbiense TaxID=1000413 RepID=A0A5C7GSV4_9ROSI|nr:hypothetical protein EZV62_027148 [Acer yangbiense]